MTFKYAELTGDVRQNGKLFIDLLNTVRVSKIDDDVKKLLKARFVDESIPKIKLSQRCLAYECRE